jgi:hypothetical protein
VGGGDFIPQATPTLPPPRGREEEGTPPRPGPVVRAAHTATFVALKKGLLNPASREWTGDVSVIDIGAPRKLLDEFRDRRAAGGA